MRTVELQSWKSSVQLSPAGPFSYPFSTSFFFRERRLFNRLTFLFFIFFVSICAGFSHRSAWAFALTEVAFLSYLFFQTRHQAEALYLKRTAPSKAIEQSTATVEIALENRGQFSIDNLILVDEFAGSKKRVFVSEFQKGISPESSETLEYSCCFDGGMGEHLFGPMVAYIQDPFGIFNFIVTENTQHKVMVYPKVFEIPRIPIKQGSDSLNYGPIESQLRGHSCNFLGVREYQRGDSRRHISWRLSAKQGKLLVKEFDRLVNTEILIFLDLNASIHAGTQADSSWEYAKDLTNSLLTQQLDLGNTVQLLSNSVVSKKGMGELHRGHLCSLVSKLNVEPDSNLIPLESRFAQFVSPDSTLIHISPLHQKQLPQLAMALERLSRSGTDVICFFINAFSFVPQLERNLSGFSGGGGSLSGKPDKILQRLEDAGIEFHVLEKDKNVAQAFTRALRAEKLMEGNEIS